MPLRFYGWFLNQKVISNSSLRILLLMRHRIEINTHLQASKVVGFSRRDICFSTGLSYNSVQSGLRSLQKLKIIQLDPYRTGSKQLLKLTEPTEYNWELIQEKLGFRFTVAEQDRPKK